MDNFQKYLLQRINFFQKDIEEQQNKEQLTEVDRVILNGSTMIVDELVSAFAKYENYKIS